MSKKALDAIQPVQLPRQDEEEARRQAKRAAINIALLADQNSKDVVEDTRTVLQALGLIPTPVPQEVS